MTLHDADTTSADTWLVCLGPIWFFQSAIRSPIDLPQRATYIVFFLTIEWLVPGGGWEGMMGFFRVHLKCKRGKCQTEFSGENFCPVEQNWFYSKRLHARWHRHWSWLGVSLCGSSVRRQEHSGNLNQPAKNNTKQKTHTAWPYRKTTLDAHIFNKWGEYGPEKKNIKLWMSLTVSYGNDKSNKYLNTEK